MKSIYDKRRDITAISYQKTYKEDTDIPAPLIKKKPRREKSERPTLTGNPPLGYQNNLYCPTCGRHLFSFYDGDLQREDYVYIVHEDWNYCIKCGTLLDLDEWKEKSEKAVVNEEIVWEE